METLGDLLASLRRRIPLILFVFLLLVIGVLAGTYMRDQIFETRAKLLIGFDTRPISVSRSELPSESPGLLAVEAVTTVSELLASREVVEQLVDDLGPEAFEGPAPTNPLVVYVSGIVGSASERLRGLLLDAGLVEPVSERDALVAEVWNSLSVFPVRQSQVIEISFSWPVRDVPPRVLDHLLGMYLERIATYNAQAAQEGILSLEAEQARLRLVEAQQTLAGLREETGIVDPAARRAFLLQRLQVLEPVLSEDAGLPGVAVGEEGIAGEIASLNRDLAALRIERAGALTEFTETSPRVLAIDARIAATDRELRAAVERVASAVAEDRAALDAVLAAEDAFNRALNDISLATEAFRTYSQAADDRRIMRLGEQELRVRVIDRPPGTAAPVGASRLVMLVAGMAVSLIIACLLALVVDRLRREVPAARVGRHVELARGEDRSPPDLRVG
jgi:uncharacterized protein involved in exopolysaccharide biosynthesis